MSHKISHKTRLLTALTLCALTLGVSAPPAVAAPAADDDFLLMMVAILAGNHRVSLSSSAASSPIGDPLTLTAQVKGKNPGGSVGFTYNNGTAIAGCSAQPLVPAGNLKSATAVCLTSALPLGTHALVAQYAGDAANKPRSSAPLAQIITKKSSTTTLSASSSPSTAGASVVFTATVSGYNPGGSVRFSATGVTLGCPAATLTGSGPSRSATCRTSSLMTAGSFPITATYDGDVNNTGSVGSLQHNVQANTPPSASFSSRMSSGALVGQPVSLIVTASDAQQASGSLTVQFSIDDQLIGSGTASGNDYTLAWTPGAAGSKTLRAVITDSAGATTSISRPLEILPTVTPAASIPEAASYRTPTFGTTPGSFGVGDSGGAGYTIPLQVAPGTAGLQPALSLSYSSQGGYGQLGVGWSLSGLSGITRCPKTLAQDNQKTGINYDNDAYNDAYCLDGARLVPISESRKADNCPAGVDLEWKTIEFRTELESYSRIVAYAENPSCPQLLQGPNRFKVWTKSGQVMEYSSRWYFPTGGWEQRNYQTPARVNVARVWPLDRVADASGNYLTIDYAGTPGRVQRRNQPYPRPDAAALVASPPPPIGAYPDIEYWPTAIRYYASGVPEAQTLNGQPNYNEVEFGYSSLESQRYYDSGSGASPHSQLLTAIVSKAQGAQVRRYALSYETGASQRKRVADITECGSDNSTCLPPTRFSWSNSERMFAPAVLQDVGTSNAVFRVADLNGDGRSDLLIQTLVSGEETVWRACLGTATGLDCSANDFNYTTSGVVGMWDVGDFDGDGRADLIIGNPVTVCFSTESGWSRRLPGGQTASTCSTQGVDLFKYAHDQNFRGDIDGDGRIDYLYYDGDGNWTTCLSTGATSGQLFSCSGNHPIVPNCTAGDAPGMCAPSSGANVQNMVFAADFNGDGKLDLMMRKTDQDTEDSWRICFSDFGPGGSGEFVCHKGWVKGPTQALQHISVLDFNGDGIPDMAAQRPTFALLPGQAEDPGRWQVCLSTGDGAFEYYDQNMTYDNRQGRYVYDATGALVDPFNDRRCKVWTGPNVTADQVLYGDFNGDGRSDLFYAENPGTGYRLKVCISLGNGLDCSDWSPANLTGFDPGYKNIYVGDFDGDGRSDLLVWRGDSGFDLYKGGGTSPFGDLLQGITTGLGATTQIRYAPLTDSSVYKKGNSAVAASREIDLQSPMIVVKAVDASNGNDGVFSTAYFYEGLLGRTDGRGTQGFTRVRQRDSSGIVSESETLRVSAAAYATDWPLAGRPAVARKYAPTTAGYLADPANDPASDPQLRLVNRVTTNWSVRPSSTCGGVPCPSGLNLPTPIPLTIREAFSTGSTQESWELDGTALPVTTSTSETFDAYGNPGKVTVSSSDGFRKVTLSNYTNDDRAGNDTWILGRLTSASVTASAPGLADGVRHSSFTYQNYGGACNGAPGVLCSETIEPGDSAGLWQETRSTYDTFGNRVSTTVRFRDPIDNNTPLTRTTLTNYDSQGRFPVSTSNALGHTETRSFDPRNGAPERITGPNGQVTTFAYDAFGRKTLETVFDPAGHPLAQRFTGSRKWGTPISRLQSSE